MSASNLQPCGTWAAYKRHQRRSEAPCELCQEAMRQRAQAQYWRHRDRYLAYSNKRNADQRQVRSSSA